jgi:hypothetical protein
MLRRVAMGLVGLSAGSIGFACAAVVLAGISGRLAPKEPSCLILNTGCWSAAAHAYNDVAAEHGLVADEACRLGSLMNFVWCNEYQGCRTPSFANFGQLAGGLEGDLVMLYQAATRPSVKTLVYMNAPGSLTHFLDPKNTLLAILLLERISREYPEAATDTQVYLQHLFASVGYQKALENLGTNWRNRLEPDLDAGCAGSSTCAAPESAAEIYPQGRGFRASLSRRVARLRNWVGRVSASFTESAFRLYDWTFDHISHLLRPGTARLARGFERNQRIVHFLDECAARYLDPTNDKDVRRMMKKEDFWACSAGPEVWQAWANVIAKICQKRGMHLLYYIPPHAHVTAEEYASVFKPEYVERVRRTFAPFPHVTVVDHTLAPGFHAADLAWWFHGHGVPIKAGYLFNVIGRLKEARLVVASLIDSELPEGQRPRYLGSAWRGEAALPGIVPDIHYVPEDRRLQVQEQILEPENRVLSTPAFFSGPSHH